MNKNYDRVSSGGVVIRRSKLGGIEVLLLHRKVSERWAYDSYHLPKGVMEPGESEEETAIREIAEETGFIVKIERKLGSLESEYDDASGKGKKLTHYFLCKEIGQVGNRDSEHDSLVWVELDKAMQLLSGFPLWEDEEEIVNILT